MYLERVFREERGRIYLRKNNGGWKRFENILKDFQDEYIIKLKKRKFRADGKYVWVATPMGQCQDECWIYAKLSPEDQEQSLILEVIETHFEDNDIISDNEIIREIAQEIWQNKDWREIVKEVFSDIE